MRQLPYSDTRGGDTVAETYACSPKVVGGSGRGGTLAAAVPGRGDPLPGRGARLGERRVQAPRGQGDAEGARCASQDNFSSCFVRRPDAIEVWFRRPQSVYRVARSSGRLEFLYKVVGRGTQGLATLVPGDTLDMVGSARPRLHHRPDVEEHRGPRSRRRSRHHGADLADRR